MPDRYEVNLDAMGDFKGRVAKMVTTYAQISARLQQADILDNAEKEQLIADPVHHVGGPNDFYETSKDVFEKYAVLINKLNRVHVVAHERLQYMDQALAETHALYAQLEEQNALLFRGILDSLESGERHGAT